MAISTSLDIEIGGFQSNIKQAQASLKGLNAEMKASDAAFKATGNAEQKLTSQTSTLNKTIQQQKSIADNAKQALEAMTKAGVQPADIAYQKMYATMMNAEAGANEAQAALNQLGSGAAQAADGAEQLTKGLNGISKKISLDQVISGIDKITGGLENAAKRAVQLGKELWNNIMDTATLADDIGTQAKMFDMTPEDYQRYKGVFDTIGEITIQEWASAKRKIEKAMIDPSKDQIDIFSALGLTEVKSLGYGQFQESVKLADNWEQVFWDAAGKLKQKVENGEISKEMADVYGEALFGKKFSSLKTLIDLGQEAFTAALGEQNVATDEAIEKDAALNDAVIKLQNSFDALKLQVLEGVAPALTDAATALDGLLGKLIEYLQKPEGQKMLEDLGTAVSGLFEDLGKIDPQSVVKGFTGVFNTVVESVQWIVDNWEGVVTAMEGIVAGWAVLKVTGGALQILNLINGLQGLTGAGAATAAGQAGATAGSNWASGFAGSVAKTLPFLAPFLLGADQIIHNQELVNQGLVAGEESVQEYQSKSELYKDSELFGLWDTLMKYTTVNGSSEDSAKIQDFADHYFKWFNDEVTDASLDQMTEAMSEDAFNSFHDIMDRISRGESFYSNEDQDALLGAFSDAIEALEQVMGEDPALIPAEIDIPENTAQQLSSEIGTVPIQGEVVLGDGTPHANGLAYVPYDNYLARLHKGERVVPAREIASRSYNSNLYVESMIMNNGTDAAGLAAAMAAAQRRTMSGYGS